MINWQKQQEMVKEAMAEFPDTFGLRNHGLADTQNRLFRISTAHSYVNDSGTVMLYTEIQDKNGNWLSYCKGTVSELRRAIMTKPCDQPQQWGTWGK